MPLQADGEHAKPAQPPPPPPPPVQPPERVVPLSTLPGLTEIHSDQVEATATLFEDSVKKLNDLIDDGQVKLRMQPMANDEISSRAAEGFTKAAFDGPTSHIGALTQYRDWLQGIADGIRASAERYKLSDEGNAGAMRRIDGV
jgi:hypothetical protein